MTNLINFSQFLKFFSWNWPIFYLKYPIFDWNLIYFNQFFINMSIKRLKMVEINWEWQINQKQRSFPTKSNKIFWFRTFLIEFDQFSMDFEWFHWIRIQFHWFCHDKSDSENEQGQRLSLDLKSENEMGFH